MLAVTVAPTLAVAEILTVAVTAGNTEPVIQTGLFIELVMIVRTGLLFEEVTTRMLLFSATVPVIANGLVTEEVTLSPSATVVVKDPVTATGLLKEALTHNGLSTEEVTLRPSETAASTPCTVTVPVTKSGLFAEEEIYNGAAREDVTDIISATVISTGNGSVIRTAPVICIGLPPEEVTVVMVDKLFTFTVPVTKIGLFAEEEIYSGAATEEVTDMLSPTTTSTFTGCEI